MMVDPMRDLIPRPREVRVEAARVPAVKVFLEDLVTGIGPESGAWQDLCDLRPAELPSQGYALRIEVTAGHAHAVIAAPDHAGLAYGRATLRQLADSDLGRVIGLSIRDWPQLADRGVIEGFYGPPWSHRDRIDFFRFAGRVKLNTFIYAPKDDQHHRDRWRDPYPDAELGQLRELAAVASANQVRFIYALAPALTMHFSDEVDHAGLGDKAEQLWNVGVRSFALLFDDVPAELTDTTDVAVFGHDADALGRAHGMCATRFAQLLRARLGITEPLLVCPTDYAGCSPSPYRAGLAKALPADAVIMWTGSDIVVGDISRSDIDDAASSYQRNIMLWDNFPVNDFDRTRLFLGPLTGRTTNLAGARLSGIAANPMIEAAPSQLALATIADWAWNPNAYHPDTSAARALSLVAGVHDRALSPLIAACSSWPPSAQQSKAISFLVERALTGSTAALDQLEGQMQLLAGTGGSNFEAGENFGSRLLAQLAPWVLAARDAGRAGVLACQLQRRIVSESDDLIFAADEARAAQTDAETHYPNILRSVLPDFVHTVLDRGSPCTPNTTRIVRRITVIVGDNPAPGDRELAERLTARGFSVSLTSNSPPTGLPGDGDLVILTRGASIEVWKTGLMGQAPVISWAHLEALGLAFTTGVSIGLDSIDIVDPTHPLAAGLEGRIRVYRGTGKITWGTPSADGEIIARGGEDALPVIVHYPAGSVLPDGTVAPSSRLTYFLGSDGVAPWLITEQGHALINAAVEFLLRRP